MKKRKENPSKIYKIERKFDQILYKAVRKDDKKDVVIKTVAKVNLDESQEAKDSFCNEIVTLSQV